MKSQLAELADVHFQPTLPKTYMPPIALIGCGGIAEQHLQAYKDANFKVVTLCDIRIDRARQRADKFFPDAKALSDYREVLDDDSIEVVDVTTHPSERVEIIEAALHARKHVLSQKPFVLDLDQGKRLVELADRKQCYLAVNQNGRWAPHFSYTRKAVAAGLLGTVFSAHLSCHWDHTWVAGTEFEKIRHLILYDYAIHWFDIVRCFFPGQDVKRVFASTARVPEQKLSPALLAQAAIEFAEGQSTLAFDAAVPFGQLDRTFVAGSTGTIHSFGSGIQRQTLTVANASGTWTPALTGQWFPDGFRGAMGELLCAIEDKRECEISALDNLKSLALCFAAIASADSGLPVRPGSVRKITS